MMYGLPWMILVTFEGIHQWSYNQWQMTSFVAKIIIHSNPYIILYALFQLEGYHTQGWVEHPVKNAYLWHEFSKSADEISPSNS